MFSCRYEGELSQRHLEGFRINWVRRGVEGQRRRGERAKRSRASQQGAKRAHRSQGGAKMAGFYRKNRSLEEEKPSPWTGEV